MNSSECLNSSWAGNARRELGRDRTCEQPYITILFIKKLNEPDSIIYYLVCVSCFLVFEECINF